MRVIIIGMGIQGKKRKKFLGREFVYSVDKFKPADFKSIYKDKTSVVAERVFLVLSYISNL